MSEKSSRSVRRTDRLVVRLAFWLTVLVVVLLAVGFFTMSRLYYGRTIEARRRAGDLENRILAATRGQLAGAHRGVLARVGPAWGVAFAAAAAVAVAVLVWQWPGAAEPAPPSIARGPGIKPAPLANPLPRIEQALDRLASNNGAPREAIDDELAVLNTQVEEANNATDLDSLNRSIDEMLDDATRELSAEVDAADV